MKIQIYITMYHCRIESKTLRQKFRESSLQGPVGSNGTLMYAWDVQELPYKPSDQRGTSCCTTTDTSSPTRNPVSGFSNDLWIAYWDETWQWLGLDSWEGRWDLLVDVPPCKWVALPTGYLLKKVPCHYIGEKIWLTQRGLTYVNPKYRDGCLPLGQI